MKTHLTILISLMTVGHLFSQNEKLEVAGAIQMGNSDDPTPEAGTIRWTGTDFEGFDGTTWVSFTSTQDLRLVDIDNNKYETVTIGTQTWMAENLRVTRFNDGTPIPIVTDNTEWLNTTTPAMTWFFNGEWGADDAGFPEYGGLYNFACVVDTNALNVCPVGWHVPTDGELTILIDFVDPAMVDSLVFGTQSLVAGTLLKESGIGHWDYNVNATSTNEYGFTILPHGVRSPNGTFGSANTQSSIWSSSYIDPNNGIYRYFNFANNNVSRVNLDRRFGMGVRCLKD